MKSSSYAAISHPIVLSALFIVLLNALVLQPGNPTWLSGKLGDAAWMVIAPILLATGLNFLAPGTNRRYPGLAGILITGITFSLLKTIPGVNRVASSAFLSLFHSPLKLKLDPSDLLVLPFLGLAWIVWTSRFRWINGHWLKIGALSLAFIALVADSPAPQPLGFTCLMAKDNRIYAFRESLYKAYFSGDQSLIWLFYSTDGGLTWTRDDQALDTKKESCTPQLSWPLNSSIASTLEYDFVPGKGIYTSQDNGKTLVLGQEVNQVTSIFQDKATGNTIFTAGREGVIVHTPDGKWQVTLQDTEY